MSVSSVPSVVDRRSNYGARIDRVLERLHEPRLKKVVQHWPRRMTKIEADARVEALLDIIASEAM